MQHLLINVFTCGQDVPVFPWVFVRTNDVSDGEALCACASGDGP